MKKNPHRDFTTVCIMAAIVGMIFWAAYAGAATAATIEIYPTIRLTHDGNTYAKDITVCWEINSARTCDKGVPSFTAPVGSHWKVFPTPPAGYSATLVGNQCEGDSIDDSNVTCYVDYADGAPIAPPVPSAPLPAPIVAPTPVFASVVGIETPTAPTSGDLVGLSEADQIAALQAQIIQLYKILISLLMQRLAVMQ